MTDLDNACEVIEQLMEPCEKCGKQAGGARWGVSEEIMFPLCQECHADKEGFAEWFRQELKTAVEESGEFEQTADGKWRSISAA